MLGSPRPDRGVDTSRDDVAKIGGDRNNGAVDRATGPDERGDRYRRCVTEGVQLEDCRPRAPEPPSGTLGGERGSNRISPELIEVEGRDVVGSGREVQRTRR